MIAHSVLLCLCLLALLRAGSLASSDSQITHSTWWFLGSFPFVLDSWMSSFVSNPSVRWLSNRGSVSFGSCVQASCIPGSKSFGMCYGFIILSFAVSDDEVKWLLTYNTHRGCKFPLYFACSVSLTHGGCACVLASGHHVSRGPRSWSLGCWMGLIVDACLYLQWISLA